MCGTEGEKCTSILYSFYLVSLLINADIKKLIYPHLELLNDEVIQSADKNVRHPR